MVTSEFFEAQERLLRRHGIHAESRFIDVPMLEGRAHVLVTGDGPPVVMVIGAGIVAGTWAPLMAELGEHTFYAVDLPGQGPTDSIAHRTETLRDNAVVFLRQVLDGLALERAPLVAHSMGGLWSTWLALANPERVDSIAYLGCPALLLGTSAPLPMRLASIPAVNRLISRLDPPSLTQVRRELRMVGEDPTGLDETCELMLAYGRIPGQARSFAEMVHAAVTLHGARPEVELTASLIERVRHPVQFLWGADDPFGDPAVGRRAAEIMSDAEFHLVNGGHVPWLHHAEEIAGHLSPFLSEHAGSRNTTRLESQ